MIPLLEDDSNRPVLLPMDPVTAERLRSLARAIEQVAELAEGLGGEWGDDWRGYAEERRADALGIRLQIAEFTS